MRSLCDLTNSNPSPHIMSLILDANVLGHGESGRAALLPALLREEAGGETFLVRNMLLSIPRRADELGAETSLALEDLESLPLFDEVTCALPPTGLREYHVGLEGCCGREAAWDLRTESCCWASHRRTCLGATRRTKPW